ncbi:hypothetical protein ACWOFR_01530 [Carnobacterium gallinarum]|uniref:hypothetical protein n=1 Tax=Carnobacterium gallinarum TaxID=2749 RepID=UPI000557A5FA|nr:hypothetical protein [Carnobacterium gallinarum]
MKSFNQTISNLAQQMGSSKHYLDGHYYRIKKENATTYKIASLVADPCGAYLYNPQLTVKFQSQTDEILSISYFNDYQTPTKMLSFSEETSVFLTSELTQLVNEIKQAYK